jgi:hypothetical protein
MVATRRPVSFPTPRHQRVYERLRRLISEGTADFFADACDISQERPEHRTSTHLVGHLLREVEAATRKVLRTLPAARTFVTENPPAAGQTHGSEINAILHALGLTSEATAIAWRDFAGPQGGLHRFAHRDDLRHPRQVDADFEDVIARFIAVLDVVLDSAEARYADAIRGLDAVIAKERPTGSEVDYVATHLAPGVTAVAHVFERLPPNWLVFLRERRVFDAPPEVVTHDDGTISFPYWPQAGYLARIAPDIPSEVADMIVQIPRVENESPHIAFLEAASRMPVREALRVARHELIWLAPRRWMSTLIPVAVGKLITHLLSNDEIGGAMELLRVALSLTPIDAASTRWRFDAWQYGDMVRNQIPLLAARAPEATRDLLFEILDSGAEDSSWRRERIEGAARRGFEDRRDHIFEQIRGLYIRRAGAGPQQMREAVAELEARDLPLYERLALHLLEVAGQMTHDLVVERATDQARLRDESLRSALTTMLRARLPGLETAERELIMDAIRESVSETRFKAELGENISDDELPRLARWELLRWFHALGPALPEATRAEYDALRSELGEPSPRVRFRTGPNPPIDAQALGSLDDEQLLEYLRNWIPASSDHFEPSREGLGRELKKCIAIDVQRFAHLARELRGTSPEYVSNLFLGVHEQATRHRDAGGELDWDSLLDLLEWTTAQSSDLNTGWTWARRAGIGVAEDIFVAGAATDHARAARAWAVVRVLLRDPDPTPERDATRGDDLDSFAINTVRGEALNAAIRIGVAIKEAGTGGPVGLLPEIADELVARTGEGCEPSLGIRCVLAYEFNNIYNISPTVAVDVAAALLPREPSGSPDRWTAWHCFLRWNGASSPTFALLQDAYSLAVDRVDAATADDAERLGSHLVRIAIYGLIEYSSEASLLRRFIALAPPAARLRALEDVGRGIHEDDTLSPELVERLRSLWEWWLALAIARGDTTELRAFGWWFTSGHFELTWSLSMLERVLAETGGRIDWQHEVLERLIALAPAHPNEVARCVERLVETRDDFDLIGSNREIRSLLQALMLTAVASTARTIAARLVARGRLEFRDLT